MSTQSGGTPGRSEEWYVQLGNAIVQNSGTVGRWWAELVGGVTNIRHIKNDTPYHVRLAKVDTKQFERAHETIEVGANRTYDGAMWVAWADNAEQYAEHHLTLTVDGRVIAYIWQSGPYVRFRTSDGFIPDAPSVPASMENARRSGGDRSLVIRMVDGQPAFVFAGYPPRAS